MNTNTFFFSDQFLSFILSLKIIKNVDRLINAVWFPRQ